MIDEGSRAARRTAKGLARQSREGTAARGLVLSATAARRWVASATFACHQSGEGGAVRDSGHLPGCSQRRYMCLRLFRKVMLLLATRHRTMLHSSGWLWRAQTGHGVDVTSTAQWCLTASATALLRLQRTLEASWLSWSPPELIAQTRAGGPIGGPIERNGAPE